MLLKCEVVPSGMAEPVSGVSKEYQLGLSTGLTVIWPTLEKETKAMRLRTVAVVVSQDPECDT